jgi:hypothetical protein
MSENVLIFSLSIFWLLFCFLQPCLTNYEWLMPICMIFSQDCKYMNAYSPGVVVAVIVWLLDLQPAMQLVHIITDVVSSRLVYEYEIRQVLQV